MSSYKKFLFGCLYHSLKRKDFKSAYLDTREIIFPGSMEKEARNTLFKNLFKKRA